MEEKLKSISKQIHWSLLAKAAIFALGWFFLPFWLFLLLALYLYFFPFFQSRKLLGAPFLGLLALTFIGPASFFMAIVFGLLFYYLLLIKDLVLIDRKAAYELFAFVLLFFFLRSFYENF